MSARESESKILKSCLSICTQGWIKPCPGCCTGHCCSSSTAVSCTITSSSGTPTTGCWCTSARELQHDTSQEVADCKECYAGSHPGHCAHAQPSVVPTGAFLAGSGPGVLVGLCCSISLQLRYAAHPSQQPVLSRVLSRWQPGVRVRCAYSAMLCAMAVSSCVAVKV